MEPTPERPAEEKSSAPWGFWATLGFSFIVMVAYTILALAVTLLYGAVVYHQDSAEDPEELFTNLASDGLLLSIATCIASPPCAGLLALFVKIRRGPSFRQYLALFPAPRRTLLVWSLIPLLFIACADAVSYFLGRPIVPEFMVRAYQTAGFLPLQWLALDLVAPLFEETLFRGFMFQGIRHSRAGDLGAVLITSIVWALLHAQYDAFDVGIVFLSGLLLGLARVSSESLVVPSVMHVLMNTVASIEVSLYVPAL